MTDKQILTRAIKKAKKNGWRGHTDTKAEDHASTLVNQQSWPMLIYRKEFAKALWGEEPVCGWCGGERGLHVDKKCQMHGIEYPLWQNMLQQMVISAEPIKYLGANI